MVHLKRPGDDVPGLLLSVTLLAVGVPTGSGVRSPLLDQEDEVLRCSEAPGHGENFLEDYRRLDD